MVQLQLSGERLQFQRLEGAGPDTGWVSLTLKAGGFDTFFVIFVAANRYKQKGKKLRKFKFWQYNV